MQITSRYISHTFPDGAGANQWGTVHTILLVSVHYYLVMYDKEAAATVAWHGHTQWETWQSVWSTQIYPANPCDKTESAFVGKLATVVLLLLPMMMMLMMMANWKALARGICEYIKNSCTWREAFMRATAATSPPKVTQPDMDGFGAWVGSVFVMSLQDHLEILKGT